MSVDTVACVCFIRYQSSAGVSRGMVKLTSQRGRKSSPTEDTPSVPPSSAPSGSTGQSPAESSAQGRPRTGGETRPPPWGRPATKSDGELS